ncbi:hypothetical protein P4S84_20650, partial [Aneurinibacillus aneurinilyticus]|nr:hypothetical protein [Aneurinibacillus aneurinilyticus]
FSTVPTHRPSFFSYLLPQKFVDLSNQMYIEEESLNTLMDRSVVFGNIEEARVLLRQLEESPLCDDKNKLFSLWMGT